MVGDDRLIVAAFEGASRGRPQGRHLPQTGSAPLLGAVLALPAGAVLAAQTPPPAAGTQQAQTPPATPAPQDEDKDEPTAGHVVFTALPNDVRTSIDFISYSLADDLQAANGTLAEALRNLPSVDVDPQGNVSLRGDSNVTILLMACSAILSGPNRADAVLQLPGSRYARIEVMTNPSAAYSPEGSGGVINLITKPTPPAVQLRRARHDDHHRLPAGQCRRQWWWTRRQRLAPARQADPDRRRQRSLRRSELRLRPAAGTARPRHRRRHLHDHDGPGERHD